MELRPLGNTDIRVSPVALGCWPIAGMTSPGVTDESSIATIRACFDLGVNHLDTAYMYGLAGESERLIARALGQPARRDGDRHQGRAALGRRRANRSATPGPATLRRECEESLRRLGTDRVELYYLHAPDPNVPVAESAGELKRLMDEGKTRAVGASNVTLAQLEEFAAECPLGGVSAALQHAPARDRGRHAALVPRARRLGAGLLAADEGPSGRQAAPRRRPARGRQPAKVSHVPRRRVAEEPRPGRQAPRDCRRGRATRWRNWSINWTIHQPGITAALCGAKRPEQIRDNAGAAGWELTPEQLAAIDRALAERGTPEVVSPA